jgi:hypothetical protein
MNHTDAIKFLLRDMPETELTQVEERSFHDAALSDLLSEAENDLIDGYVRGELTPYERERFEHWFLVSERRIEKVRIAQTLLGIIESTPPATVQVPRTNEAGWLSNIAGWLRVPSPAFSYAVATAALIFLFAGLWMFTEVRTLRNEVTRLGIDREAGERRESELETQADEEREHSESLAVENERLAREVDRLASGIREPQTPSLMTILLTTGFRTADGPQKVEIPRTIGTFRIHVRLNPADEYPAYVADLQTSNGNPIRRWNRLRSSFIDGQRTMIVDVPTRLVPEGSYELTVKGVAARGESETLGYYYFNVTGRK